jgi:ABC-type molybdate transport system substrate-binding protein
LRIPGSILLLVAIAAFGGPSRAADLTVYAAGSLRESIGEIAKTFGDAHGVSVTTHFGPSGRLREQIDAGDRVDLFASADLGHPRQLVADGRSSVMAMFARNAVCQPSPPKFGATTATALDRLLDRKAKIGISIPKADPLGDYTMALFARADRLRPGSGASLKARAVVLETKPGDPPPKSGDAFADAILDGRVAAVVVYCSSGQRYARLLPDAALVRFPPSLRVGPEYALAVMKNASPDFAALALAILSPEGQKTMQRWGFEPVALPAE